MNQATPTTPTQHRLRVDSVIASSLSRPEKADLSPISPIRSEAVTDKYSALFALSMCSQQVADYGLATNKQAYRLP